MTYQVLARKWRPRIFEQLIGQQHVIQAIVNSIDNQKLHHAYLFTGTRGVGKTTIARIFAKSLNCLTGPTSKPCLNCASCQAIEEGSYPDLLEVDAASRTRVEDTKEILDNVQYAPTVGRYKIYLIDEVHMLSGHSFNALLKTLEEPPAHVVFLLATTDPQKIPVTVLSRCLQFYLKPLTALEIASYLSEVAQKEQIDYQAKALDILAQFAKGSLRDALSLLDQAIAYTAGNITSEAMLAMLGAVDDEKIAELLQAIIANDGQAVLTQCQCFAADGVDFNQILQKFMSYLHQISLVQMVPHSTQGAALQAISQVVSKEDIQLFYEICIKACREIAVAPVASVCFEMAMLRMMVFKLSKPALIAKPESASQGVSDVRATPTPQEKAQERPSVAEQTMGMQPVSEPPIEGETLTANIEMSAEEQTSAVITEPTNAYNQQSESPPKAKVAPPKVAENNDWVTIVDGLSLQGIAKTVLGHCKLIDKSAGLVTLGIETNYQAMLTSSAKGAIEQALQNYWQENIKVQFDIMSGLLSDTPARQKDKQQQQAMAAEKAQLTEDACLSQIVEMFDAQIDESNIQLRKHDK